MPPPCLAFCDGGWEGNLSENPYIFNHFSIFLESAGVHVAMSRSRGGARPLRVKYLIELLEGFLFTNRLQILPKGKCGFYFEITAKNTASSHC